MKLDAHLDDCSWRLEVHVDGLIGAASCRLGFLEKLHQQRKIGQQQVPWLVAAAIFACLQPLTRWRLLQGVPLHPELELCTSTLL